MIMVKVCEHCKKRHPRMTERECEDRHRKWRADGQKLREAMEDAELSPSDLFFELRTNGQRISEQYIRSAMNGNCRLPDVLQKWLMNRKKADPEPVEHLASA